MAEQEIIKHTREVVKIVKGKDKLPHKLGDVALEIAIIVFAITLSFVVERWRESQQERKLEHNFLTNLKVDLTGDLQQLRDDSVAYAAMEKSFTYIKGAYAGKTITKDSLQMEAVYLYNVVGFLPASGRYEALKASGKLDVIEDKDMQLDIVNLYQTVIPSLVNTTTIFNGLKGKLDDYIYEHLVIKEGKSNLIEVAKSPVFYNLLSSDNIDEILGRYHITIIQISKIIKEIEKQEK